MFGGGLKVHCLKRGVTMDCVEIMLRKCMTQMAHRDALDCKIINGRVVSAKQASYEMMFRKMERKGSWVDVTRGMSRKKKKEYQARLDEVETGRQESKLGPDDKEAFNFDEGVSCQTFGNQRADDDASEYTQAGGTTLGGTRFEASDDGDESEGSRESDIWKADSGEEEEGGFVMDGMEIVRQANDERRRDDNDRDKVNQEKGMSEDIEESEGEGGCTGEEGVRNGMGGEASNPPGKEDGGTERVLREEKGNTGWGSAMSTPDCQRVEAHLERKQKRCMRDMQDQEDNINLPN